MSFHHSILYEKNKDSSRLLFLSTTAVHPLTLGDRDFKRLPRLPFFHLANELKLFFGLDNKFLDLTIVDSLFNLGHVLIAFNDRKTVLSHRFSCLAIDSACWKTRQGGKCLVVCLNEVWTWVGMNGNAGKTSGGLFSEGQRV